MSRSRLSPQHRHRRVRDSRRTRRIFGLKEDSNRWYRCHHCGFALDIERDGSAFPNLEAPRGDIVHYVESGGSSIPSSENALVTVRESRTVTLNQIDAAGDDVPVYYEYTLSRVGCPFCGTRSNRA